MQLLLNPLNTLKPLNHLNHLNHLMSNRASWSGSLAFVLAAAASAIGLGNLWRFPYLAAQYGGGMFIAVYLVLVVTLGFTLMVTEIAVGRKTQQSPLMAYSQISRRWGFIGVLGTLIPLFIVPYYCVIGGWVLYYLRAYAEMAFTGANIMGEAAANSGNVFGSFISAPFAPFGYGMLFILGCAAIISLGVKNGIEKSNLVMMPILFLMALGLSIYVVTLPGSMDGIKYYIIPNLSCVSTPDGKFSYVLMAKTILGAAGQMFYSLSLAMGIMITYGSYMKKGDSIERCVRRIEFFDTLIALIAGLMIIPVVYMFAVKTGTPVKEAMNAGPGLMFVTLPKVFAMFGPANAWIGFSFFLLVLFAAATSAISLFEACVSSLCDYMKMDRKIATAFMTMTILFLSSFSAMGYGAWGHIKPFHMQFLDFFDFFTNSVMMPVVAIATCIFIGWFAGSKMVIDECEADGSKFRAKRIYSFMVKYLAPILLVALLVSEVCRTLGIKGWSI